MKGYCKQCSMVIDETEQTAGYCYDCYNDRLVYPILFSDLDTKSKDGLMHDICKRILLLEKADKKTKEFNLMRESYFVASNILEEVHFKVEKVQSEFSSLKVMLSDMKKLFQKGWGVPK